MIGMWSLLYISGSTSHSSLCAIDGVLKDRSMFEKLPFPRFICVVDVSFSSTKFSLKISFSIVFPLTFV